MAKASQLPEQAAACRDLARRARRLAGTFLNDQDRERLLQYAEEMEQRAGELEQQAAQPAPPNGTTSSPVVTQPQQQVQQQQASEPAPNPPTPKTKT
jgi:hypothetical protein